MERIDPPLCVFQTELTNGGAIEGADTLIAKSKIKGGEADRRERDGQPS